MKNFLKKSFTVLFYLPILHLIFFYSFLIRAIIKLGYFPTYENPDPNELGFEIHQKLTCDSANLIYLSMCAILIYVIHYLIKRKVIFDIQRQHLSICIVLLTLVIVTYLSDFFTWFVD